VLYIDDMLKQKYTERPTFTEADIKVAFMILNGRYLMNKPTIISSEWDLIDQLMEADEGVFSRVYERCKKHIVSIDRNPENNYRLAGEAEGL
jgi:DNA replication protein DnaC